MIYLFILLSILKEIYNYGIVCSEDELLRELREDIMDNGQLDCLKYV